MENNGTIIQMDTEAAKQLQERLNSERTLKALDHLLARIDTLEQAVDRLATTMEQGPGMVSMVTDMVDEAYQSADHRGVNLEQRFSNALQLLEQLTAPAMVEKLKGLMTLSDQIPGLVSMATDMIDEGYQNAAARNVNLEARLGAGLQMLEKLTDPEMVEKLNNLFQLADQLPGLIAMTVDMVDEEAARASNQGIDFPALLALGSKAGQAVTEAQSMPKKKVGIFGLMRELRHPDRQKALAFLMNITEQFGKKL